MFCDFESASVHCFSISRFFRRTLQFPPVSYAFSTARVSKVVNSGKELISFSMRIERFTLKVVPDTASLRQDSLRQDSLKQRVAYRAPGFERSCAQNGRKTH